MTKTIKPEHDQSLFLILCVAKVLTHRSEDIFFPLFFIFALDSRRYFERVCTRQKLISIAFGYHFLYCSIWWFLFVCFFACFVLANLLPRLLQDMLLSSTLPLLKSLPLWLELPTGEDNGNLNIVFEMNLYIFSLQVI